MSILSALLGRRGAALDPASLPVEGRAPEFADIAAWLNGPPLTMTGLRGRVVLVDFWTYSCINCLRTLPCLRAWHRAYKENGLVIVGVHAPEFNFERDLGNVKDAVARFGIEYPVAVDNDHATWKAYRNRYWPAHYFIDAKGNIRYQHFGEGSCNRSEAVIRALLAETGAGAEARAVLPQAPDISKIGTPETYLGYERVEYLGSPEPLRMDAPRRYSSAKYVARNVFYLEGTWKISAEYAAPTEIGAKIIYRYSASSVHLIMDGGGNAHRVRLTLDGAPLSERVRGIDVVSDSALTVRGGRLYDLVDARGVYGEHLLALEFPDPGVKCYAFTFG